MAQTIDPISTVDADIEVSLLGTVWVNISGSANEVQLPEQKRMTGVSYTFDGDLAIVTQGKREPTEATINALYTEVSGETFETVRPWFQAGNKIFFRYSPKGIGASARSVFTASNDGATAGAVTISSFKYPDAVANTADPTAASFKLMVPGWVRTATGNSTGLGS